MDLTPTEAWVAQQLREATPFDEASHFLIRNRDSKYEQTFTRIVVGTCIEVLKTPYGAPKANAVCEWFLGSVRKECLDHIVVLGENHLYRAIKDAQRVQFFNLARPHQGMEWKIPEGG